MMYVPSTPVWYTTRLNEVSCYAWFPNLNLQIDGDSPLFNILRMIFLSHLEQQKIYFSRYFTPCNVYQVLQCIKLKYYCTFQISNAAVMVFIHGGGYMNGNGYFGYYSGIPLSSVGDVIIVTINYRLTAFGFLTTGSTCQYQYNWFGRG